MPDEVKEATSASPSSPKPQPTPAPKPKPQKPEKMKLKLTGAGSCNYGGIVLRKNEIVELEASQAEQFIKSGLFERS